MAASEVMLMRGFYFSAIVFVAVFLLLGTTAIMFSNAQRDAISLITRETQNARVLHDVESDELRFTATAYEVLANNSIENSRSVMEKRIADAINAQWNAAVKVWILNASSHNTRITLNLLNYTLSDSGVFVNLTGANYSTVVGNAFFHFSQIYETFNASDICPYVEFTPEGCSVDNYSFAAAKYAATGFAWSVTLNVSGIDCNARLIPYYVNLTDVADLASLVQPFQLRSKSGGFEHRASC